MKQHESIPAHFEICNNCRHFFAWPKLKKNGSYTVIQCGAVPSRDKNGKTNDGKSKIGFIMGEYKKGTLIPFRPCYNGVPPECPYLLEHIVKGKN